MFYAPYAETKNHESQKNKCTSYDCLALEIFRIRSKWINFINLLCYQYLLLVFLQIASKNWVFLVTDQKMYVLFYRPLWVISISCLLSCKSHLKIEFFSDRFKNVCFWMSALYLLNSSLPTLYCISSLNFSGDQVLSISNANRIWYVLNRVQKTVGSVC